MPNFGQKYPSKLEKKLVYDKMLKDADTSGFESLFNSIGRGIDRALELLLRNGETNLNKTFNSQEAEDFLKRFK